MLLKLLKHPAVIGLLTQALVLAQSLAVLDAGHQYKILRVALCAWNVLWALLWLIAKTRPASRPLNVVAKSRVLAAFVPLALAVSISIGGWQLWTLFEPWLGP